MRLKIFSCLVIVFWASLFTVAQEPVDIDSLVKEISVDTQQNAFAGYFYRMEFNRLKKNFVGKGKLVKRYEVLLPSFIPKNRFYQHPLLLVYDSSKNLMPTDIINSRNLLVKELEKIENDPNNDTNQKSIKKNDGGYVTLLADSNTVGKQALVVNLLELIKGSEFSNAKEVKINGRDTISIDFHPILNKGFSEKLFYLAQIEGIILIDKADKRIIEVEAFPLGKLKQYRSQPVEQREEFRVFHYLQTRVPEGFWFPQIITLNFLEFSELFNDLEVKIEFTFSDYKRFDAQVRSVQVKSEDQEKKPNTQDPAGEENEEN